MQKFEEPVQNLRGDTIALAPMLVLLAGTDTPASIYFDAAGQIQIPDPRTDRTGVFAFYAPNGRYDVYAIINGIRIGHKLDLLMYDPADAGGDAVTGAAFAALRGSVQVLADAAETTSEALTVVQDTIRGLMTNLDFVPQSERAAILAGTSTYDATAAVQAAIDAAGSTYRLRWLGTVNTGALSSAASVDWEFEAGAKVKQIPATYPAGSWHVSLTGPGVRINGGEFDGNQDAMTTGQGSNGLLVSGASPTLLHTKTRDYNGRGHDCNSVNVGLRRGLYIGCSFDDNAGLGMMTTAASYVDLMNCTFDRNGYGFRKARANYGDTSHSFVAFGIAIRMRSHHINLIGCQARDNGRDGININQGSYAIKHAQCLAVGNDDGGFTIAADNTGTGMPGESEACYDISYDDCEAYNNYSSGLAAYQPCHNVRVNGGRFYNNHRLAGNQPGAASYYNGIFFAGNSSGISVDASVYDDRQARVVTAVAGGAITATGWVPGTMNYYPKVAVYAGADQSFRGYARITAESAGSVTITPTASHGVSLAAIVAGDYITQAVQHGGVFMDNNCRGTVAAEGAGMRPGAAGGPGRLIYSGGYTPGQNIFLPKARKSHTELLVNPTFDADVTNWTFSVVGGSANYHTGANKRSAGALQLTAGAAPANGDSALVAGALAAVAGSFVEYDGWVYAAGRDDAYITLFWFIGTSSFYTEMHHPGGGWRYLNVGPMIPGEATSIVARVAAAPGKTVYFDSMSLRAIEQHADSRAFSFPSRYLPV